MSNQTPAAPSKGLHIALWVLQALLAFAFLGAGTMKLITPAEELIKNGMSFVETGGIGLARFIGASEAAGGLGLLLPAGLRIAPWLTPLAAAMLALVMALGVGYHVMADDAAGSAPALVLGGLSLFVAWGRSKAAPIAAR